MPESDDHGASLVGPRAPPRPAVRAPGHDVRIADLQTHTWRELDAVIARFAPGAVGFGLTYPANVPEVIELAHRIKRARTGVYVFAGGHSVSFIARHVLEQAGGAIDAVLRGEGEVGAPLLLAAGSVPGAVTLDRAPGTRPDELRPDAVAHRPGLQRRAEARRAPSPVRYELPVPDHHAIAPGDRRELYVHGAVRAHRRD